MPTYQEAAEKFSNNAGCTIIGKCALQKDNRKLEWKCYKGIEHAVIAREKRTITHNINVEDNMENNPDGSKDIEVVIH